MAAIYAEKSESTPNTGKKTIGENCTRRYNFKLNTKNMKAYIKIDATKELPKKYTMVIAYSINYTTFPFAALYDGKGWLELGDNDVHGYIKAKINYWLKEISLTELTLEFADWKLKNCHINWSTLHELQKWEYEGILRTSEEIYEIYLTQKEIITKD